MFRTIQRNDSAEAVALSEYPCLLKRESLRGISIQP